MGYREKKKIGVEKYQIMSNKIQGVPEAVANGLTSLRNEQRALATKLSELQMDLNEHKLVIETLEKQERDRRCFRLVGGVLVERKVGEVEPALIGNKDKLGKLIESLEKQLTEKGGEINGYIEKHNIQIQGSKSASGTSEPPQSDTKPSSGVLVSSGTE